jgi:lipopolysaccharide transport system ATP-binding protein
MLKGEVVLDGPTKDAVNRYVGFVLEREDPDKTAQSSTPAIGSSFRHGDGASRIVSVQMLNSAGRESTTFLNGDPMKIRVRAEFDRRMDNPVVGILIRNRVGIDVFGTNTRIEGIELGCFQAGDALEVDFLLDCLLSRQEYTLTVATQYANGLSQDWLDDAFAFLVIDPKDVAGVLNMKTRVEFTRFEHAQGMVDPR